MEVHQFLSEQVIGVSQYFGEPLSFQSLDSYQSTTLYFVK